MNKLTPEQALADIDAERKARSGSHWFQCACALADWNERFKGIHAGVLDLANELRAENTKLRAELDNQKPWKDYIDQHREILNKCLQLKTALAGVSEERDALRAELDVLKAAPDATEPSALARFLPLRPADVPAPPDGFVYVGMGFEQPYGTRESKDISAWLEWCAEWNVGQAGRDPSKHYAIRWTAPSKVWHEYGLLAPSEGGGWIPHTPGDAMPCEGRCEVLLKGELDDAQFRCKPGEVRYGTAWCWDSDHSDNNTIGWRPALAEVAK